MFSEIKVVFFREFWRLEKIYHTHKRKHTVGSRFIRETVDLLGLNGSTVGNRRRLYSTVQEQ